MIIGSPADRIARVQCKALFGKDRHGIVLQVMGQTARGEALHPAILHLEPDPLAIMAQHAAALASRNVLSTQVAVEGDDVSLTVGPHLAGTFPGDRHPIEDSLHVRLLAELALVGALFLHRRVERAAHGTAQGEKQRLLALFRRPADPNRCCSFNTFKARKFERAI